MQRGGTKTQITGNLHSHKWRFLVQNVQANLTVEEKCKVVDKQKWARTCKSYSNLSNGD